MAAEQGMLTTQPISDAPRYLIIVAKHETDLWHYLMRTYGAFKRVQVLLDRRQRVQPYEPERRRRVCPQALSLDAYVRRPPFEIVTQR